MKTIGIFLGIIVGAILVLAIGGGLLTLLAFGVGWTINHIMGMESFQATALSMAGIVVFLIFADRIFHLLTWLASSDTEEEDDDDDDDDYDDEYDEFDDDDDEIRQDSEEMLNKLYAGIPRWRRPSKTLDFSNTKPDDRCPCGSGRKYKNCHGVNQKKFN